MDYPKTFQEVDDATDEQCLRWWWNLKPAMTSHERVVMTKLKFRVESIKNQSDYNEVEGKALRGGS